MEQWQDQAVILGVRPHGETGAVVSLLSENQGRQGGYVHGAFSRKSRGTLEVGNIVDARWQSRVEGNLGTLSLELSHSTAARFLNDPLKLAALQSACALCDAALPEREGHPGLYRGLLALLETLESEVWGEAYVMWEIALLRELGFSLDLSKCAGDGSSENLAYVSPKTGRAVSLEKGEAYKDRLLALPYFLRAPHLYAMQTSFPLGEVDILEDILAGIKLTGYFLEHWVFTHHTQGVPEARQRLYLRFESAFVTKEAQTQDSQGISKSYGA